MRTIALRCTHLYREIVLVYVSYEIDNSIDNINYLDWTLESAIGNNRLILHCCNAIKSFANVNYAAQNWSYRVFMKRFFSTLTFINMIIFLEGIDHN